MLQRPNGTRFSQPRTVVELAHPLGCLTPQPVVKELAKQVVITITSAGIRRILSQQKEVAPVQVVKNEIGVSPPRDRLAGGGRKLR